VTGSGAERCSRPNEENGQREGDHSG